MSRKNEGVRGKPSVRLDPLLWQQVVKLSQQIKESKTSTLEEVVRVGLLHEGISQGARV